MPSTFIHRAKWVVTSPAVPKGYEYACHGHLGDVVSDLGNIGKLWMGSVLVINKRDRYLPVVSVDDLAPEDNIPCEVCTYCVEAQGDNGL